MVFGLGFVFGLNRLAVGPPGSVERGAGGAALAQLLSRRLRQQGGSPSKRGLASQVEEELDKLGILFDFCLQFPCQGGAFVVPPCLFTQ